MKKQTQPFKYSFVLKDGRTIKFNVGKSKITGSLGVKGDLIEDGDPTAFDGIIHAGRKKNEWGVHMFRYVFSNSEHPYVFGTGEVGIEIRTAVLAALFPPKPVKKTRRKK